LISTLERYKKENIELKPKDARDIVVVTGTSTDKSAGLSGRSPMGSIEFRHYEFTIKTEDKKIAKAEIVDVKEKMAKDSKQIPELSTGK